MEVIRTAAALRQACRRLPRPLGLVPTMGSLHRGHLSLVRLAAEQCASVVVSVFVNPAQFGPAEDLSTYPRDLDGDLGVLARERVDIVFTPSAAELYPAGMDTRVAVRGLSRRLEGKHRPGHFEGVATVVAKLFNIVGPDRAYFGQKDGQQLAVVRAMARDLNMPVEIVAGPTVRDDDGLALSSRNSQLTGEERRAAAVVYRGLRAAESLWRRGERRGEALRRELRRVLASEPLVAGIDYASVSDPDTVEEMQTVVEGAMVSTAVRIGGTRLIDNILLSSEEERLQV